MHVDVTVVDQRFRVRRPSRAIDCPFCGAVVMVRSFERGGGGQICRCCGWWRVERADGGTLEESADYLRRRHGS